MLTGGRFDWVLGSFKHGLAIIVVYASFYSLIYGTIPATVVLFAIYLDNKFRRKVSIQPIKAEARLLLYNVIIILLAGAILAIRYFLVEMSEGVASNSFLTSLMS